MIVGSFILIPGILYKFMQLNPFHHYLFGRFKPPTRHAWFQMGLLSLPGLKGICHSDLKCDPSDNNRRFTILRESQVVCSSRYSPYINKALNSNHCGSGKTILVAGLAKSPWTFRSSHGSEIVPLMLAMSTTNTSPGARGKGLLWKWMV